MVREFAVELEAPAAAVVEYCAARGVNPGLPLGPYYEEHPNGLLVAITEQRTREQIDRLGELLAEAVAAVGSGAEVLA